MASDNLKSQWECMADKAAAVTAMVSAKRPLPTDFVGENTSSRFKRVKAPQHPAIYQEYRLKLISHPHLCIATEWTDDKKPRSHKKRESTKWSLEPLPVLELTMIGGEDADYNKLACCPNVFCIATLCDKDGNPISSDIIRGRHSSSLFKLEREKNPQIPSSHPTMGVFLFDQIHVAYPGEYRLLFTLFEMQLGDQGMHAVAHHVVQSNKFTVLPQPRKLPKPEQPSEILKALAAQGAKFKMRKPTEEKSNKRKPDYSIDASQADCYAQAFGYPMMPMTTRPPMMPVATQPPGQIALPPRSHAPNIPDYNQSIVPVTTTSYYIPNQAQNQISPEQSIIPQPEWMQRAPDMHFGEVQQNSTQSYTFTGSGPTQQVYAGLNTVQQAFNGSNSGQQTFAEPHYHQSGYTQANQSQHNLAAMNHVHNSSLPPIFNQTLFNPFNQPQDGFDESDFSQQGYSASFNNDY